MFTLYGQFYGNLALQTGQIVKLPDSSGAFVDILSWGYSAQTPPGTGIWFKSQDLRAAPYGVPATAKAVRLSIKAKAKTITWAPNETQADIQVAVKPSGSGVAVNECIHASATRQGTGIPAGVTYASPGEQVSHATVDVPLGPDGKIDVFAWPSIIGAYGNADLIIYLAGYWA